MTNCNGVETVRTILRRRSGRAYRSEQIRDEELKIILQCGLAAPSGGNCQYSRFLVMQDAQVLETLNGIIREELASREIEGTRPINKGILRARQPGYHFIRHAPTLISVVSPRDHENSMANCACALENMLLACESIGLAACWSNQPHWLTDVKPLRDLFMQYGLREDEDIFCSVSIGYPQKPAGAPLPVKAGRVVLDCPREIGL